MSKMLLVLSTYLPMIMLFIHNTTASSMTDNCRTAGFIVEGTNLLKESNTVQMKNKETGLIIKFCKHLSMGLSRIINLTMKN